jgi:light-regulated signal transduction histidine kinase (bacteriophytochrome)
MGNLIDDLLAFSRLGRQEMANGEIDMTQLMKNVWEEVKPKDQARVVEFSLRGVPAARGDRSLLRQAVMNLFSNAVKYSNKKKEVVIEVGAKVEERENIYFVRDNGVGFDMAYVNKLFGVFQRLHSEDEFEGTGVGLAIVQRIIARHGGRVWAEGKVNEGAVFYFSLPRNGG